MAHEHHQQYTCPMHPEVIKDAPGQCPKCGMNLVPVNAGQPVKANMSHAHHGHRHHAAVENANKGHQHGGGGHAHHAGMIDDFKKRFYVVLALTVPVMALSPMIQHWLKVDWSFPGSGYLLLACPGLECD